MSTACALPQPIREFDRRPRLTSRLSTYAFSITASSIVSKFGLQIKKLFRNEVGTALLVVQRRNNTLLIALILFRS